MDFQIGYSWASWSTTRELGKVLSNELKQKVVQFSDSDGNSRICSRIKGTGSNCTRDGEMIKHKIGLVPSSLSELCVVICFLK